MQEQSKRVPNKDRTDTTRKALVVAARKLFVEKGYAETGTPEIVAVAGVTRGALYHHFEDKAALFFAVAMQAANEVSAEIGRKMPAKCTPRDALSIGAEAYFAAMSQKGRSRLLLLDAPSVLDPVRLRELNTAAGEAELHAGLNELLGNKKDAPLRELTLILSAAFDRAALAIAGGESPKQYKSAIRFLLSRLS
jgi:AcrR family transcriptional regulator